MAELTVKAHYNNNIRTIMRGFLKVTFPIWGLILPIVAFMLLFPIIAMFRNASGFNYIFYILSAFSVCTVVPIACLAALRWLAVDTLVIDRNCLRLPSFSNWLIAERTIPWTSIRKVQVVDDRSFQLRKARLIFYRQSGSPIKIELARLKPQELEPILLAIELWCQHGEPNPQLKELSQTLKSQGSDKHGPSYTEMWEEELERRFCTTVFMPLESGHHLQNGRLRVIRPLALGGFAAIYLCHLDDKQLVVLKESVIPDDANEGMKQKALELFDREAVVLMKLNHPNIVKVMDCFVESSRHYLTLEHVNGQDLRQHVKQNGPVNEAIVLDWSVQIVKMLKYLHEQDPPIIHRDLSPDNLVLNYTGDIVLIDFGAANEFLGTATGTFIGKHAFISPEQFRGKAVVQSDIYSLGGTLHYLLTGIEPEPLSPSSPKSSNPKISEEINEVVQACTQMEVADRYQSAAQLLPVLTRLLAIQGGALEVPG